MIKSRDRKEKVKIVLLHWEAGKDRGVYRVRPYDWSLLKTDFTYLPYYLICAIDHNITCRSIFAIISESTSFQCVYISWFRQFYE